MQEKKPLLNVKVQGRSIGMTTDVKEALEWYRSSSVHERDKGIYDDTGRKVYPPPQGKS